jgi:SAM-dependent methyltransferase
MRLARARRQGPADFLLTRAAADLVERSGAVLRDFVDVLDLGTPGPHLASDLISKSGLRTLVRASPLFEPAETRWLGLVADEEALPFGEAQFDLVVSALSLQQVNDLPGALVQVRRILKPDGLFLACLAGGRTLFELRAALAAAEAEIEGGISPRIAPFADVRDMGGLLQRAGFALPVADIDTILVRYDDCFGLLRDLRAMGATNVLHERRRTPLRRAVLIRAAEFYRDHFADADGRIRATFDIIWLSGWAPHASQQKPLRPGSAKMRLADALKLEATGRDGD